MYNTRMDLEYTMKGSSWIDRITAWGKCTGVVDFIVQTDNPYIDSIERYNVFTKAT